MLPHPGRPLVLHRRLPPAGINHRRTFNPIDRQIARRTPRRVGTLHPVAARPHHAVHLAQTRQMHRIVQPVKLRLHFGGNIRPHDKHIPRIGGIVPGGGNAPQHRMRPVAGLRPDFARPVPLGALNLPPLGRRHAGVVNGVQRGVACHPLPIAALQPVAMAGMNPRRVAQIPGVLGVINPVELRLPLLGNVHLHQISVISHH